MTLSDLASTPSSPDLVPDRAFVRNLFSWLAPSYNSAVVTYSLAQDLRWKRVLVQHLHLRRGERALDLACGTGLILERLARSLGEESVTGLDVNRPMLIQSSRQGHRRSLVLADSEVLPFREGSFDAVTAGYLFKYIDLDRLSAEVRRVLRPGGRFGGYDFSRPITDRMVGRLYAAYLRRVLPWLGRHRDNGGARWETLLAFLAAVAPRSGWEDRIESALHRAGFADVERVPSLGGAITWVWAQV